MRERQGVTSTPTGVYIDVHEQGAHRYDAVFRCIYAVLSAVVAVNLHIIIGQVTAPSRCLAIAVV